MRLITSPLTRLVLGAAFIAASLSLGSTDRSGCDPPSGGDIAQIVPADSPAVVVIESLERTRAAAAAFLSGIEGASGLLELAKERYGVDLRRSDGFAEAGIDGQGGLSIFTVDKGIAVAMSVFDAGRWQRLMTSRATLLGVRATAQGGPGSVTLARSSRSPRALRLAWGVTGQGLGLAVITSADGDAEAQFRALAGGRGGFFDTPAAKRARAIGEGGHRPIWAVGAWTPPFPTGRLPVILEAQLEPAVRGLQRWRAALTITGNRLALRANGGGVTEGKLLPASWFSATAPRVAFESVLPRMSTVMVRTRTGLREIIDAVPAFLLERFLPAATPTLDRFPLPPPSTLLGLFDGNAAVAVLGLDDDALLTQLADPRLPPEVVVQYVHMAAGIGVTNVAAARDMIAATAESARKAGYAVARVGADVEGVTAYSFVTRRRLAAQRRARSPRIQPRTYAMVLAERHRALFFITGRGEVARFLDVAAGRALALDSVDGDQSITAAVEGDVKGGSAVILPMRIARELADKGVPPFFLKMLSDLHVMGLKLNVGDAGVELVVDVQQ